MVEGGWVDPFGGDDAARERERRRVERERLRRDRASNARTRLGDRVREGLAKEDGAPEVPPPATSRAPAKSRPAGPADIRRRRRVLLAGVLVAGLALVVAGIVVVANRGGGGSTPPPPPPPKTTEVTIAEGHDRAEVTALLKKTSIRGNYSAETKSFKGFDPSQYGAQNPASLEGFLFPDTYELPKHPTVKDLIARQLQAFKQNFRKVDMGYASSKNLTPYDVLIIASMIEEEVAVPDERKLVAAVIYNRLHDGMPLGIDATIRYITGNHTEPLTQSELAIDSPYNTRTHVGLPPGPIDSPGLASIQAAAHPANVPYLYYVVKPGTCPPQLTFSSTQAQFLHDQAVYNEARNAAGGKSPTGC